MATDKRRFATKSTHPEFNGRCEISGVHEYKKNKT